jgi:hypothetical protein
LEDKELGGDGKENNANNDWDNEIEKWKRRALSRQLYCRIIEWGSYKSMRKEVGFKGILVGAHPVFSITN